MVNRNFITMQQNFDKIQENFRRLLLDPEHEETDDQSAQGSVQVKDTVNKSPVAPLGRPKQLQVPTPPSVTMPEKQHPPAVGTATLRDQHGKELNLDGTAKVPYRHPNFGHPRADQATAGGHAAAGAQGTQQAPVQLEELEAEHELEANFQRSRPATPIDCRRNVLTVKPAKLNLSEFEGDDPDSWIQNLEQYFSAARTPVEHRSELAVSYLKGPAAQVLGILQDNQLYAKMDKCSFGQSEVEYLGHVINKDGVATDPAKILAIQEWPAPTNVTELRSFLGLSGYYRRFIQGYGVICRPLFDCLKKDAFSWTDQQQQAFLTLKEKLTNAPVLALPNFTKPFILEADACGYGLGAVLMQGKAISYFSKSIGPKAAVLIYI